MELYRQVVLPWLIEQGMGDPATRAERRGALREAAGRVLEIGFGFGGSLSEYPREPGRITDLVGLEPNPGMIRRARARLAAVDFPVRIVRASGTVLPFPDFSFDTVVTHWTLCSLPALPACLREIRRVLRPAGRYLFLEHGLAHDPRYRRRQRLLAPLYRILGDGCRPDLPIDEAIRSAGLAIETLERYEGPRGPRSARQLYRGAARRSG